MPHDRNGKELKKGDRVTLTAVVDEVYAADEFCNVRIAIGCDEPHGPANVHGAVTLNTRQVEKIES